MPMRRTALAALLVMASSAFAASAAADVVLVRRPPLLPVLGNTLAPVVPRDPDAPPQPGLLGTVHHLLVTRPHVPLTPDTDPRNATPRDAARERDATSLGCTRAPGVRVAGLALVGAGAAGVAFRDIASLGRGIGFGIEPAVLMAGGGAVARFRW